MTFSRVTIILLAGLAILGVSLIIKGIVHFLRIKEGLPKISRYTTRLIGYIELISFTFLYLFLAFNNESSVEIAEKAFVVSVSWIGIKTLGYEPDDRGNKEKDGDKQDQTSTRYVFLLGTIMNIVGGIIIGTFVFELWSK